MSAKRVLVSVLNYSLVDDTIATLRNLESQSYGDFDLELVDNASPNDCVARIRAVLPHIKVVQHTVNSGYSGGMNSILERGLAAGYQHVVVCNNDIELDPDGLEQLVTVADAHPDAGIVGGVEIDYFTGNVRAAGGAGFSLWRLRCDWNTALPAAGEDATAHTFVQGALLLFTRRALEAGVRMDGKLFMYYEEADMGFQLRARGLRAYLANTVMVRHKAEQRFLDLKGGYYAQRNRVYMVRKYGRTYHVLWHLAYEVLFELPVKLLVRSAQGHARYGMVCIAGFRDGVRGQMGRWDGGATKPGAG